MKSSADGMRWGSVEVLFQVHADGFEVLPHTHCAESAVRIGPPAF